jgi:hypothetical protein
MATVSQFNLTILHNIEKPTQYLAFNQSSAWDFSIQSPNLAKGIGKRPQPSPGVVSKKPSAVHHFETVMQGQVGAADSVARGQSKFERGSNRQSLQNP